MQRVGHDGFGDGTVVLNVLGTEVEVEEVAAVVESGERLVDLENLAALRAEGFAPRENAQQQNLRVRLPRADLLHDGGDAFEDVGLGVVVFVGIVGADHDDGGLGLDAIELAMFKAPEDVLDAVAADAEVDDFALAVKFLPHVRAPAFPALRDGVADEFDVVVAGRFLGALQHERLTVGDGAGARHGNDGGVLVNFRRGIGRGGGGRIGLRSQCQLQGEHCRRDGEREVEFVEFHARKSGNCVRQRQSLCWHKSQDGSHGQRSLAPAVVVPDRMNRMDRIGKKHPKRVSPP